MSQIGILEDFRCLDVFFDIVSPHMIPFWNSGEHVNTLE